jgi:uncharacterized protein YggE
MESFFDLEQIKMKLILFFIGLALINAQNSCCDKNVLSVIGAGTVSTAPDIGQFTVTANTYKKTTASALSSANDLISQVSAILSAKGLPKSNYTTQGISLYPQYDYSSNVAVLTGQQASLTLSVTVGNLTQNKQLIGQIITALSSVNNITISGISFSNSNPDLANRLARSAAVADALAKAKQYSCLSGKTLGSVKKVVDQNIDNYIPYFADFNTYSLKVQTLQVPYGQVTTSASVQINWNLSY